MEQESNKIDKLYYFNLFFNNIPWYRQLKEKSNIKGGGFGFELIGPEYEALREEMNCWLHMAYEYGYAAYYRKRLSRIRSNKKLWEILNELEVAHFLRNNIQMEFKECKPPAVKGYGEWIFAKDNNEIFIEVHTPFEKRKEGTYMYIKLPKLMKDIGKKYKKQKPTTNIPFIIFIIDSLALPLTYCNEDLLNALYGRRAECFSVSMHGHRGQYLGNRTVEWLGIFQRTIRRQLSAVAVLKMEEVRNHKAENDNMKYLCCIYHNPFCREECRLNIDWFRPYKQYLSHDDIVK